MLSLGENWIDVRGLEFRIDSREIDLFFSCPKSVDIEEIFKEYTTNHRKRTSSAVWNTPPDLESH